jgi:hypothetical protein
MSAAPNPPAFPCEAQGDRSVPPEHDYLQTGIHSAKFPGMSLRDWFAGQALAGTLARQVNWDASIIFQIADAMLAERAKVQS